MLQSLKAILSFLKVQTKHVENVEKFITNLILNFYDEYINPPESSLEFKLSQVEKDIIQTKIDLFQCLNYLSPSYYCAKINNFTINCFENIFKLSNDNYQKCLQQYFDDSDLYIAIESETLSTRFSLFNEKNFVTSENIKKNEQFILNYDSLLLKYKESSH